MPLLEGQPFKLINPPEVYPIDSEIYTIQHTGEKFLKKSDYEDRLALYSQTIWTCQCTGHTGLTHKEAWMSEAKTRVAAKTAVPLSLQKPLLTLVHHSLSPLEQLIDAAYILCHSQFHVGEELIYTCEKPIQVRITVSKDIPKVYSDNLKHSSNAVFNGKPCDSAADTFVNGTANGVSKDGSPGALPDKENEAKDSDFGKEDSLNRKVMLPKFYDVITEDNKRIENVPSKKLMRPYKLPSKDQLRLFIRSCALRHRGSTCTPWVVSDDLVKKFNISNKLPSLFLSSPKPNLSSFKRKAPSMAGEVAKRPKPDVIKNKKEITKVPPLLIKSENSPPKNLKIFAGVAKNNPNKTFFISPHLSAPSKTYWGSITKHPLSLGKPKLMSRPNIIPSTNQNSLIVSKTAIPRKRGRPPLSKEEKERNKKLRQATLFDLSNKLGMNQLNSNEVKMLKIKTKCDMSTLSPPSSSYFQHPLIMSPYKSPVKRATTPEAIMRLPFMRRFLFEHKTIKGVFGQFRRYAHTMDLVLAKLSSAQIEMIPEESLKQDLLARQKKVQDKEFLEALTPEEKKQYVKDKARTMALERWKERKLKNLKVEDKTVAALIPLPKPSLVETPEPIANSMFGDIVMITDFIKCFRELLLGEEKFLISSCHLMEALHLGSQGNKVIVDIMCCLLPLIIHDDISKNCKEVGFPISVIPITYQTAHELARLCLRKQDDDDTAVLALEDAYQIGKEKSELSDELMNRLESCELWELSCEELVSLLKALVHKALCTASVSVYVEEVEEKVLKMKRERRKVLKDLQKDQKAEVKKKKEERMQNRLGKGPVQKRQRGRPRGRSPKSGSGILQEYFTCKMRDSEPLTAAVQKRRLSVENSKKENEETLLSQKERQKQLEENQKRQGIDKKYDDMVIKRDNLIRRTPIGLDRDHNRYWIFHTTTPGLFVEKCWADLNTDYKYSLCKGSCSKKAAPSSKTKPVSDEDEKPLAVIASKENEEDNKLLASVKSELIQEEENKPLAAIKSETKDEVHEDNKPLSDVKSKLTISPMKMTYRGRPPKEAYVLMDEDTQTFPEIGENSWYYYKSIEDIQKLVSCLSDEGQRESQLKAAINVNMDRIQKHFNINSAPLNLNPESPNRLKGSLKEDIIQIEKELIEGWLGQVPSFDDWEHKVKEADDVTTLGALLIEAQRHMQIKYLKSVMAPVKEQIVVADAPEGASAEYEDVEGPGVERWREAVLSCRTYSRLHVLVGLFDSCIKWEKSMATRKCKVCRNKTKEIPLAMCDKCHISYHYFCLRPPLKEDPGESWTCPACKPKKTRREEKQATEPAQDDDPEEKNDPTFSVVKVKRQYRKRKSLSDKSLGDQASRVEKECVICFGRIGLIFCAHCSTAYHSECHNPPLMSRARKDWVCGACSNHPKSEIARKVTDALNNPTYRRNYFGNVEEAERPKRRGNTTGLRDRYGRFLKNTVPPQPGSVQSSNGEGDSMEPAEDIEPQMDKFGRHIRGAKAKALENISVDKKHKGSKDSRRSSRNPCKRQSYKDDSENENSVSDEDADEESENGESENGDSDSENESSESRDENESENEEAENENDNFDSDDKNRRKMNNVNINKNTKANVNAKRRINSDSENTSEDESDSEETEESEDEVNTCIKNEGESDSEEKEESEDDVNNSEDEVNDCTKNESNESDGDDSENENDSTSDEEETDSEGSSGLNTESEYEEFLQNRNQPSWRTLGSYEGADKERTMRK